MNWAIFYGTFFSLGSVYAGLITAAHIVAAKDYTPHAAICAFSAFGAALCFGYAMRGRITR